MPLGVLPDQEIAAMMGVSTDAVAKARKRRGRPPAPSKFHPRKDIPWESLPLGVIHDSLVAKMAGCSASTVTKHRKSRGIPRAPAARGKCPKVGAAIKRTWASRPPAVRTEITRRAAVTRISTQPHSARSAASRKGLILRYSRMTPEERLALVRPAIEASRLRERTPEERARAAAKARETWALKARYGIPKRITLTPELLAKIEAFPGVPIQLLVLSTEVARLSQNKGERWRLIAAMLAENPFIQYKEVADKLGVTRQRVHQIAQELGLPARTRIYGPCEACGRPGNARRAASGRILCDGHADQWQRQGRLEPLLRDLQGSLCSTPGCGRPAKSLRRAGRPLCERHYDNWLYANSAERRERHSKYVRAYYERRARGEVANPLPRCFDCAKALRPRQRVELDIGGDRELFCGACAERRGLRQERTQGPPQLAPPVILSGVGERIAAAVRNMPDDLREEVQQELWVQVLSGELHPDMIHERVRFIRRRAMVAAADRSYSVVSLDDTVGDSDLTYKSALASGED
jgi:hypothetical protein